MSTPNCEKDSLLGEFFLVQKSSQILGGLIFLIHPLPQLQSVLGNCIQFPSSLYIHLLTEIEKTAEKVIGICTVLMNNGTELFDNRLSN